MKYRDAGVDIDQADRLVELIRELNARGREQIGPFAGIFELAGILRDYRDPLLVSSTDGIGTKTRIALEYRKFGGLGQDLVAMNVNDIVCLGAKPLFFLDYYATARLDLEVSQEIFSGLVRACAEAGCVLIGGETAQLPDLFVRSDEIELVGFVVGGGGAFKDSRPSASSARGRLDWACGKRATLQRVLAHPKDHRAGEARSKKDLPPSW
jgi:phosphoribosylformylglycinamidine cyclo-ligase